MGGVQKRANGNGLGGSAAADETQTGFLNGPQIF